MSQIPPTHSVNPNLDAAQPSGKPKSSGLALAAMIIGIASFPLLCLLGLGVLTGILAVVLGIIALVSINKNPTQGGKGLAITGIVTGGIAVVLTPLLIAILLPSLGKARELSQRSVCAANIRGIMQSMVVYSSDNSDYYPYLGPSRIAAQPALARAPGGLMNDIYVLVSSGQVADRQFLCRSDPAKTVASAAGGTYWTDPAGGDPNFCYSYSFAFQYSAPDKLAPWYKSTVNPGIAIAGDMNPGNQLYPGKTIRNSLNHQGEGQNVSFADAHSEFVRTPTCGTDGDHIYNVGPSQPPTAPGIGGMPFPPPGATSDTCLEPLITNSTTYTRG